MKISIRRGAKDITNDQNLNKYVVLYLILFKPLSISVVLYLILELNKDITDDQNLNKDDPFTNASSDPY